MWAFEGGRRTGGNNITGFKDDAGRRADREAEDASSTSTSATRSAGRSTRSWPRSAPTSCSGTSTTVRLLYWNKFGTPPTVLSKYGDESAAYGYWWYDEDAAADLEDAMQNDLPLPPRTPLVVLRRNCSNGRFIAGHGTPRLLRAAPAAGHSRPSSASR